MNSIRNYLDKQGIYQSRFGLLSSFNPDLLILIPAYKEKNIFRTLASICEADRTDLKIEILIYLNGCENDGEEVKIIHQNVFDELSVAVKALEDESLKIYIRADFNIPLKRFGVGMARKLLMDEAVFRFYEYGNASGIMVNLDADTVVRNDYCREVYSFFATCPQYDAASIHFEHRFENHKEAIIEYELHLRYFIGMQRLLSLPYAYQTIGSAMACTVLGYVKVGGMNTRKAGEDFYFMHKFSKRDALGEIKATVVMPSDRISDRVPFGTGKAIRDFYSIQGRNTYHYQSFKYYLEILEKLPVFYGGVNVAILGFSEPVLKYLEWIDFVSKIIEIKKHTSGYASFVKRFYQQFDAFQFMKYLHFQRDEGLADLPVNKAIVYYLGCIGLKDLGSAEANLMQLRVFDKSNAKPGGFQDCPK